MLRGRKVSDDTLVEIAVLGAFCCTGDGNCFYRAFIVALIEDLAATHSRRHYAQIYQALHQYCHEVGNWAEISSRHYRYAREGYKMLKVFAHGLTYVHQHACMFA